MINYATKNGTKEILLTFDDGPHATHTPKLLDELAKHNVKALFFVVGKNLESAKAKQIMRRAADEGHWIGNHTYSHPNLKKLDDATIKDEILRTEGLIGDADRGIKILRPPYGSHDARVDRIVRELGYDIMLWNVDSLDWHATYKGGGWVEHALTQIKEREDSTFLAHDIHATTVARIPELLAGIAGIKNTMFASITVPAGPALAACSGPIVS